MRDTYGSEPAGDAIRTLLEDHRAVAAAMDGLLPLLEEVTQEVIAAFAAGGRLYAFGNGGSAADAQHLVGELIGRYRRERRPLPAVSLSTDPSVVTCIANDYAYEDVFARQVSALAGPGDVVVGFSTGGTSPSVIRGLEAARAEGATTVLFSGGDGGPARQHADHALIVPSSVTARVQEMHVLLLHLLSEGVDLWAVETTSDPASGG